MKIPRIGILLWIFFTNTDDINTYQSNEKDAFLFLDIAHGPDGNEPPSQFLLLVNL